MSFKIPYSSILFVHTCYTYISNEGKEEEVGKKKKKKKRREWRVVLDPNSWAYI